MAWLLTAVSQRQLQPSVEQQVILALGSLNWRAMFSPILFT